jgi:hypothetical protein
MVKQEGSMGIILSAGTTFGIDAIGEQYVLYPGDTSRGLLRTRHLYEQNKDPLSGDYNFGMLTELYFNLQGNDKTHWRHSAASFRDIHHVLKLVIKDALTHRPDPLEIQWGWNKDARPAGPNIEKGVSIVYDSATPKYLVLIFGYTMPA